MAERLLVGWTVGVTADRRAEEQIELLQRSGARVVHGPTIRTQPLGPDEATRAALAKVVGAPPDLVVLTTGLGTRAVVEVAETVGVADQVLGAFENAAVYVRGPKASGAAQTLGLTVHWQAPGATSAELVAELDRAGVRGRRIAVQLDGRAEPALGDALRDLGAEVIDIPVYRWTLPDDRGPADRLIAAACARRLDALTFTSSPALWNLLSLAGERRHELLDALRESVRCVSVGSVCTSTARQLGIEVVVEPERPRLGAMTRALGRHAEQADRAAATKVGGATVVLRAACVVVDGVAIELSEQERAVLTVLLERPGSVVSKRELLQHLWSADSDPHVAEVAVSRLRRRLDDRLQVRVVPQRGYLLTTG